MSEKTYYQRNKDVITNRGKGIMKVGKGKLS